MKSRCPLLARHIYGLNDQHHVPNIPCDRADQEIFLFPHLTYFHKLNGKAATKLIRALLIHKSPLETLFHPNEMIIVSDQNLSHHSHKIKRTKCPNEKQKKNENYSQTMIDLSTHVRLISTVNQSLLNALQTSINDHNDNGKKTNSSLTK